MKRAVGKLLYAVGRATNIYSGYLFIVLIFVAQSPRVEVFIMLVVGMLLGAILGLKLQLRGKQLQMQNAHQVDPEDLQSPILYLRPFKADPDATRFSDGDLLRYLVTNSARMATWTGPVAWAVAWFVALPRVVHLMFSPALTDEEQLVRALKRMGPTIAVANPEVTKTPVGIPRLQLDGSTLWQDQVHAMLNKSQAVLLLCGTTIRDYSAQRGWWPTDHSRLTGGLGQEFHFVAKEVSPERLVLLVPFDHMEYETFADRVQGIFPKDLPPYSIGTPATGALRALIGFDKEWNSRMLPVTWLDTCSRIDTRFPLTDSLRLKFEWLFSKECISPRPRFVLRRTLATAVDLTLVGGILLLTTPSTPLARRNPPILAILLTWVPLLLVASCLYSSVLEASSLMATYGKKLVGLMVTDTDGHRITFYNAVRRALAKYCLLSVSCVPALFGKPKAFSHDGFAATEVRPAALRLQEPPKLRFVIFEVALWLAVVFIAVWFILAHSNPK